MNTPGRRIRVAHCIETLHLGGVEQTRLMLARSLDSERFEQRLYCTTAAGALPAQFEAAGCRVVEVGKFQRRIDPAVVARVTRELRSFKPDIVHGGVYEGVIMAVLGGLAARVPVIVGEETSDPVGRRLTGHFLFRALAGLTDAMVAVSPFVRDYLVKRLRIPQRRVVLINNGVTPGTPTPSPHLDRIREELGLAPGQLVLGTVSRLHEEHKRVSDAIRALALLHGKLPPCLVVVGSGPDEGLYRALAQQLDVVPRVHFVGYQADARPWFDLLDIFLHVPASEAFGLVVAEAMMASKPVIATPVGGIPSIVIEGQTGLLVPTSRPDLLAEAITTLWHDEERRRAMGSAGRLRAVEHYSEQRYAQDMTRLYERLAGSLAQEAR